MLEEMEDVLLEHKKHSYGNTRSLIHGNLFSNLNPHASRKEGCDIGVWAIPTGGKAQARQSLAKMSWMLSISGIL